MLTDSKKVSLLRVKNKKPPTFDNSDMDGKIHIRRSLLHMLGKDLDAANCTVLEAYGGEGKLYDACYSKAPSHIAFDIRKIDRFGWIQGDNKVLLPKHVNYIETIGKKIVGWDLYDLDAYSNPWELASIVCEMRLPGTFGIVTTCCLFRTFNMGNVDPYMRQASGIDALPGTPLYTRYYDDLIELAVSDWARFGVKVLKGQRARSKHQSSKTKYYAFLCEKVSQPQEVPPKAIVD